MTTGGAAAAVPSGRGRKRRPQRREQILDAAIELFYERGYAESGMEDIGRRAGLSSPAIYRHFRSKEEILSEVLSQGSAQILARVEEIVESAATPAEALDGLIVNYLHAVLNKPELAALIITERRLFPPSARAPYDRADRLHMEEWVHALSSLRPELTDGEVRLVVHSTTGIISSVIRDHRGLEPSVLEELIHAMARGALLGQGPRSLDRDLPAPASAPATHPAPPVDDASGSADGASTRARRPKRREIILEAAADRFAKHGFIGTGIDDIGAAAGISGPGVYRHFSSKDEILTTLVERAVDRLISGDDDVLADEESPARRIHLMIDKLVSAALDNAALAWVAWNETSHLRPEMKSWIDRLHRMRVVEWVHVLSRLEPGRSDLELATMVDAVYSLVIFGGQHAAGLDHERTAALLRRTVTDAFLLKDRP